MSKDDICAFCSHSFQYHSGHSEKSDVVCLANKVGSPYYNLDMCGCEAFKSQNIVNRQLDNMHQTARHESKGKLALDQLPVKFLRGVAAVLNFGMLKYAKDNWKQGTDWSEFYGSTQRHLLAWWDAEETDPESGLSHLAHAACNIAFLIYYQDRNVGKDDRDKSPTTQQHLGDKNPGDRETTS